jgi:hypothetical protein
MQGPRWFTIDGRPFYRLRELWSTLEYFGVLWRRFAVLSMYFGYAYSGLIWEAAKPKKLPAERVVNE